MGASCPYAFINELANMPNWCDTSYIVTGEKEEVCDLYEKMKSLEERDESLVENGIGKTWLGNLVVLLGGDWEQIRCRGWWGNLCKDCDDGALRFNVESAWAELWEVRQFLQDKYPSLDIYYQSEEPGMGIYVTNDRDGEYFPERIKVEHWGNEDEYFEVWEDVYEHVAGITHTCISSVEELHTAIKAYNNEHPENCIYVNEFQIVKE